MMQPNPFQKPHAERRWRRPLWIVLLLASIPVAAAGWFDVPLQHAGLRALAESNQQYLERSIDKAVTGFLILSGIKTGLAVIEGSEVGIGFNLEVGDLVQSIYDYVDIAWKTALAGGTVILLTRLLLQVTVLLDHWTLAATLAALLVLLSLRWFLPGWRRTAYLLKDAVFFLLIFTIVCYLLVPFSIAGAAFLSEKITDPLIEESQRSFEGIKQDFSAENLQSRLFPEEVQPGGGWLSALLFKGDTEAAKAHFREQAEYFRQQSRNIAIWTLQLIAGYLFDSIVFPAVFFILLFVLVKGALNYLFEDRRQRSLQQELAGLLTAARTTAAGAGSAIRNRPLSNRRYYPRYSRRGAMRTKNS
jgi:hypothetical protein